MKKLLLSVTIISALGLSGCGNETIKDVKEEVAENATPVLASARVVFDPANGNLSVPNDLLFLDTPDGTLNIPITRNKAGNIISGEKDEEGNEIALPNYAEPSTALGALDGWSTTNPFLLDINFPTDTILDANSVSNPASIQVFETLMGGDNDIDCKEVPRGAACKVVAELIFGVDFVAQAVGNSIAVVPLKPLKGKTTYIVALTNNLEDNNGKAVAGSVTYESVRQNITTHPLATPAQLGLQGVINSYENAIVAAGADKEALIFTMALTTQSTVDVLMTIKGLLAASLGQGAAPSISINASDTSISISDVLFSKTETDHSPERDDLYFTGNYHTGSITLPYYLGVPSVDNPKAPVNGWWKSLCDSGAILAGVAAKIAAGELPAETIPADAQSIDDGTCMAISAAKELPAPGLRSLGFDTKRHLTKFSPVPKANAMVDIDVQMTTPVISDEANAIREAFDLPSLTAMPEAGWPVVILQHGITSKKEYMLSMTGILSAFGFATVAIDQPLHGSRGFDIVDESGNAGADGIDDINASTVSAAHYMNLASLLTTRDNLRQSTADLLGLRLAFNALVIANSNENNNGDGDKIDNANVHFLGHSLGGITGINFMALTNSSLGYERLDSMFAVNTSSQAMPGSMMINFLMGSPAFGDAIKSSLTFAVSKEFQVYVAQVHLSDTVPTEAEMRNYYHNFYTYLTLDQQAELNGAFAKFTFVSQTVTDAGDPANYAAMLVATNTPTHLIEIVGDGSDNLGDQVIPNTVSTSPMSGTEGTISLLGLMGVSETAADIESPVSGAVRFLYGHHSSILRANAVAGTSATANELAVTAEIQNQVANFFLSNGHEILVTNTEVVN
ncbi:MAG: lipase [Colwellia sp.]|nr:lipase [Colwellia sp.]